MDCKDWMFELLAELDDVARSRGHQKLQELTRAAARTLAEESGAPVPLTAGALFQSVREQDIGQASLGHR